MAREWSTWLKISRKRSFHKHVRLFWNWIIQPHAAMSSNLKWQFLMSKRKYLFESLLLFQVKCSKLVKLIQFLSHMPVCEELDGCAIQWHWRKKGTFKIIFSITALQICGAGEELGWCTITNNSNYSLSWSFFYEKLSSQWNLCWISPTTDLVNHKCHSISCQL